MSFNLCIFCGSSSPQDKEIILKIENLINQIVSVEGINLVYGGAKIGLMGKVAEKFLQNGKEVLGVMPGFLKEREVDHHSLTTFIETESMHERKQLMYDKADAFLVLPGGYGTLDELFEASCWSQLNRHEKPISVFNPKDFYGPLQRMIKNMEIEGFISPEDRKIIHFSESFASISSHLGFAQ